MVRLLFIGTFPPPEGGITLLAKLLLNKLQKSEKLEVDVINITLLYKGFKFFFNSVSVLVKLFYKIRMNDLVTFQTSANTFKILGPIVYFISKLYKKPLIVRRFAGNGIELYKSYSRITKYVINKTVFRADLTYYETSYQVDYFSKFSMQNVKNMPNHRDLIDSPMLHRNRASNFVFIGYVCPEKGINEIIKSFCRMRKNINIDIYGSDGMDIKFKINNFENIKYMGEFKNQNIYKILSKYDALILPSYWKGEGHPGVVVESLITGLPVIATNLKGISEIVEHNKTGLLISPKADEELYEAVTKLNENSEFYLKLKTNIAKTTKKLDAQYWYEEFEKDILSLL
ncbi:MAG: glycosyltransferase [Calditrichaeota bacterium]|nr:MAG: glycosyltransferase [Calditrichota bacterium]MBL1203791.1 glycosyltransferase [Calditrichota bacterium]NOG43621.1 glycosyltransferase [Calditrichota bacterium]